MRKSLLAIIITAFALIIAACSSDDTSKTDGNDDTASDELVKVRMAVQPWVGNGPAWIAEELGIDEKHGIELETISFEQDSDMNAALASGDVDVGNLATHTTIRMQSTHDLNPEAIIFIDESEEADAIIASGDIQSIADLKGQKVAFEEGTTSELLLQQALSEEDMTLDDIEAVFMPAAQAGLAMISGDVEIAVTYAPYINEVLDRKEADGFHLLYTGKESPGLISDLVVAKAIYFEENPEIKEKLRDMWEESLQYWRDNEEEGNEIVAVGSGITVDELPGILSGLKFFNFEEQVEKVTSGELMNAAENIQRLMLEGGSIEEEIDLEAIFDME